ncbi:CHASE2 domain-containing protein [Iningainema tapete]|uniref:CHASE2 domain-containing protein n=1 Tax=Iningainema tapete BLCC-T55 TaxID=2748662 RepID=A0A8J6XF38_9CYAN|nr:CHASE2 domain-containing protein [Iningainema tapete]MBD2771492.1 CHASE2 domain-containing protein [Iningainema tapete BLCC-T55]
MHRGIWKRVKDEVALWRVGVFTGIVVIGLIMVARMTGSLQELEWLVFDSFLRWRPTETIDERILIVGINEGDIRSLEAYPVPDGEIANILRKLQKYQPRVIGIDTYRNIPVYPGYEELKATLQRSKNLIAIEKVLPDAVDPPRYLPPKQVGFTDQIIDTDGKLRRSLLGTPSPTTKEYKFSLTIRLAEAYLAHQGITLQSGKQDKNVMRFGKTELPRFSPDSGGYVKADAGGVQLLLNFRSGKQRFRTISLRDVKTGRFNPSWVRDRIVILGVIAPSVKDFNTTSAIPSSNRTAPGQVYGVEIQAHACSQIISAVLNNRPLITTWSDKWEYVWIIGWGILGMCCARITKFPLTNLFAVSISSASLIGCSYLLLSTWGLWIPVTPAMLTLTLNGVGLTALFLYDQSLRSSINARQTIIEHTFETIHNGPLQTLAKALKQVRERDLPPQELLPQIESELEKLNHDLRGIYDFLQRQPLSEDSSLYISNGIELNLQNPIQEILYQVYKYTLERDFPCFKTLKVKIRAFEHIEEKYLNIEQKRALCRFLEEALCNIGKHAVGVTRIQVTCTTVDGWFNLTVIDDGLGIKSFREGRGTQQFKHIAKQLKGKFRRSALSPKGTICELTWPGVKFGFTGM